MKNGFRYALYLASCLLCGTSCQQEEPEIILSPTEYISFGMPSVTLETVTKAATDGFLDELPTDGSASFGVLGYCLAYNPGVTQVYNPNSGTSMWNLKRDLCPPSVFYKKQVKVQTNGACVYETPKKWYTDGLNTELGGITLSETDEFRYSFFAYYPYEGNFFDITPGDAVTAGAPIATFHLPWQGGTVDDDRPVSGVPDAMLAIETNVQRGSRTVDFNFNHILTGLGFQVNNYSQVGETVEEDSDKGVDLRIFSIKLKGTFYRSVKVDMTQAQATITYSADDTYSGTFTVFQSDDLANGTLIPWQQDGSQGSISMKPTTYLRLLPGNDEAQGYFGPKPSGEGEMNPYLEVDYQLGNNARKTEKLERPGDFNPRSGVRYTAQINWVNDAFVLIMQPDNGGIWEDGEADDGKEDNDDIIFQ